MKAVCIFEPRGDHGLEGYQAGDCYQAERVAKNEKHKQDYYRVWPAETTWPNYYETCSVGVFNKYFEIVG